MKRVFFALLVVFLISLVSAEVVCTPSSVTANYISNSTPPQQSISCTNNANESSTISKLGSYFSISETTIGAFPSTKSIIITFDGSAPAGIYYGWIAFSGNVNNVPVTLNVTSIPQQPEQGCRLIELPHTTTYRIKQGETGLSSQIMIKVSKECTSSMAMTVIEQTQMSKPMFLQGASGDVEPGEVFSFTIGLDAVNVATGVYTNTYTVSGSIEDEVYQKAIPLSTIVTVGTSPVDNATFSKMPVCTFPSETSLNNTYSLICTNENPNIDIEVPYNNFFEGISVSESEGKFEYKVIPKKIGNTDFVTLFKYKGVVIGEPFIKAVRIVQGNVPVSGTTLKILFYQEGIKKSLNTLNSGETNILVKDNSTDTIVSQFTAYLNGISINATFNLEANKNYELIISSPGYLSETLNFTPIENEIQLTINPSKEFYIVGEVINITTDVNASLLLDGYIINSPYTLASPGNKTLEAVKEGYKTTNITLIVKPQIYIVASTPILPDWRKGKNVVLELSEPADWKVLVMEKSGETFLPESQVASGTGNRVEFKIEKEGEYKIKAGDILVTTNLVESKSIFSDLGSWVYVIIGTVIIIGIFIYFKTRGGEEETGVGFELKEKE